MVTPDLITIPFANSGDKSTVPATDSSGFVNFTNGYTSFYEISLDSNNAQAKAVERPIQNYLFNLLTSGLQSWQQQSVAPWYSTMPNGYALNATVMRLQTDGVSVKPYRSLVANNVSDPLSSSTWEYVQGTAEMLLNVPFPSGGPTGPTMKVLTSGRDFNLLQRGTFEVQGGTVAAACANLPVFPGSIPTTGVLEADSWSSGAGGIVYFQRYTDANGRIAIRIATNLVNAPWTFLPNLSDVQSGSFNYVATTGTANAYAAAPSPAIVGYRDGMVFNLFTNVGNTGASTLSISGLAPVPLYGSAGTPLVGGEVVTNGMVTVQYIKGIFYIISGVGVATQGVPALADNQVPNLGQVKSLISDAALTSVDWSDIVNKPTNFVFSNTVATLAAIELVSPLPQIDFRYGNSTADYTFRLVANDNSILSLHAGNKTDGPLCVFGSDVTVYYSAVSLRANVFVQNGSALFFTRPSAGGSYGAANQSGYIQSSLDGTLSFNVVGGNGTATQEILLSYGQAPSFRIRPIFAGNLAWDAGNFNPANKLNAIYAQINATDLGIGSVLLHSGAWPNIASLTGQTAANNFESQLVVGNNFNNSASATMVFYRGGQYAVHLGLDTDNILKVGGWSMGAVAYPILHTGNLATYLGPALAAQAYDGLGSYGLFMCSGGTSSGYQPLLPGATIAGSNLIYCATGWIGDAGFQIRPTGTWQACGHTYNYDGSNTDSITVCRRIA